MDSDSDSPFNYSWPSFPKMRILKRRTKPGNEGGVRDDGKGKSEWEGVQMLQGRNINRSPEQV